MYSLLFMLLPVVVLCGDSPVIHTIVHPIHFMNPQNHAPETRDDNATTFADRWWDARNFPANPNTDRSTCRMTGVPSTTTNTVCNPDSVITDANGNNLIHSSKLV